MNARFQCDECAIGRDCPEHDYAPDDLDALEALAKVGYLTPAETTLSLIKRLRAAERKIKHVDSQIAALHDERHALLRQRRLHGLQDAAEARLALVLSYIDALEVVEEGHSLSPSKEAPHG